MSRILNFTYGTVVYIIFLGSFVYAPGFLGNLGVPKSIDSGEVGPLLPALLVNTVLLGLFAIQHTGMARKGFKQWWTKIIPPAVERSTYVLATSLALILMYWLWRPIPEVVWSVENPAGRTVLQALFWAGWITALAATFMIHHFDLFGLRQVYLNLRGKEYRSLGFRTPGFYKYVRHPIQGGFLIAFWATPTMTVGHLFFALGTTGYILIAVKCFEERDLKSEFGATYRGYMEQVPGFVPVRRHQQEVSSEPRLGEVPSGTPTV